MELGALGEFVGAFVVVATLLYVGLQVRQNTKAVRGAAAHNATQSLQSWYVAIATNPQAAHVFRRGMSDPSALSEDDAFVYLMNVHCAMLAYQNVFFLGTEGTLDASLYLAMSSTMVATLPTPGFQWYWKQRADFFTPEFRVFVEELMASGAEGGAEIYK